MLIPLAFATLVSGATFDNGTSAIYTCTHPGFTVSKFIDDATQSNYFNLTGKLTTRQRGYTYRFELNEIGSVTVNATIRLDQNIARKKTTGKTYGQGLPALQNLFVNETIHTAQTVKLLNVTIVQNGKTASTFSCDLERPTQTP